MSSPEFNTALLFFLMVFQLFVYAQTTRKYTDVVMMISRALGLKADKKAVDWKLSPAPTPEGQAVAGSFAEALDNAERKLASDPVDLNGVMKELISAIRAIARG